MLIERWQGGILKKYRALPVERLALDRMEYEARLWNKTAGHYELSPMHKKAVQLERAIMRHYPHLDEHEMLRWVASNIDVHRLNGRRKEADTFQAAQFLDHASAIMSLREHLGLETVFEDLPGRMLKRLPVAA
jgi:hypothetical protein